MDLEGMAIFDFNKICLFFPSAFSECCSTEGMVHQALAGCKGFPATLDAFLCTLISPVHVFLLLQDSAAGAVLYLCFMQHPSHLLVSLKRQTYRGVARAQHWPCPPKTRRSKEWATPVLAPRCYCTHASPGLMQMDAEKISVFCGSHRELGKDLLACSIPQSHPSSEPALYRSINASPFLYGFNYCVCWAWW